MKYYLALLLILASSTGNAQKKQDSGYSEGDKFYMKQQSIISRRCRFCSIWPPGTVITPGAARNRFTEFKGKVDSCKLMGLAPEAVYSDSGALAFLTMLTNSPRDYGGFRAYFVIFPSQNSNDSGSTLVPDNHYNQFALVFVPTLKNADDPDSEYQPDDTTNCVVIKGNSIEQISPKYASMWMHKADKQVLQCMEQEGKKKTRNQKYQETRSLWYDITFIKHDGVTHNGLIDILTCRMKCDCKSVHAVFGGFLHGKNKHQLCAIFMIGSDQPDYISLWKPDLSIWGKRHFLANDAAGGSDTGRPCPPPSPCSTMVGALLPNP